MKPNADELQKLLETPEAIAALERAALRDVLAKIERGEGEQEAARRQVGDTITLLMADIAQRQDIMQNLQRVQLTLSTKQNYIETQRAAYEARSAAEAKQ